jgi:hypothetical protein
MASAKEDFLQINPNDLGRRDSLGEKGFDAQLPQLKWIFDTIKEAIQISENVPSLPPAYNQQIEYYATYFVGIANNLKRYTIDSDAQSQYNLRNTFIRQIDNFYASFFNGAQLDSSNKSTPTNNFLSLVNSLKMAQIDSLRTNAFLAKEQSEQALKDVEEIKESAKAAVDEISRKAFSGNLVEYAVFFDKEARLHSRMGLPKIDNTKKLGKKKSPPMGGAEKWLIAALSTTGIMILMIVAEISFFLHKEDSINSITVALTVILAILFFLARFFFKQYSIHKHLFTLNRHRSNSLSSFFSMAASGGFDETSRSEISKILAKSIYESTHTGYITKDTTDSNLPVVVDAIKNLTISK